MQRQNAAEKVISTCKDYFKAILVGMGKTFSMHIWDWLLPQAESTLNMLRPTNIAPKISAYAYIYWQHDFNKMPLAPIGYAVLVYNKPLARKRWDDHEIDGYYIKMSWEHYRCYKICSKNMRSTWVADMAVFKHQYITVPTVSKADAIVSVVNKLTQQNINKYWRDRETTTHATSNKFQLSCNKIHSTRSR